ncbi:MAG: hypothetical protein C7B46_09200 [Sulfobacillus benefaciens]|uniref:CopG family transcriptional regulator n=1 Tax=Sulfobacillus benefaciens TaxID=453960 RepID=A0A2T2XGK6_9FIRM|nr:MAG: hypothetical protein C7B46_09200 [Sulfobacillus benefaciens]
MGDDRTVPFDPNNDEEAAAWFDTHSSTELPGERVKNVTVTRRSKDLKTLTIRIDARDMERLQKVADRKGIGYTTMARMLLHQELQKEETAP